MNLIEWRTRLGINQAVAAEKLGVEQSLLSKWERGIVTPTLPYALKIHQVTGGKVTMADLVPAAERR